MYYKEGNIDYGRVCFIHCTQTYENNQVLKPSSMPFFFIRVPEFDAVESMFSNHNNVDL